ncbi:MAG: hypothetical protein ACI3ZP_10245 [Candidatus Cryptobacteroides sp.]
MRQKLLLLLLMAMPMFSQNVLAENIPIIVSEKRTTDNTRPHRVPGVIPVNCSFDDINCQVEVTFTTGIEEATVRLTNLTTGEITTTYDITSVMLVPIPAEGQYLIEIILANGREYYGMFDVTDNN